MKSTIATILVVLAGLAIVATPAILAAPVAAAVAETAPVPAAAARPGSAATPAAQPSGTSPSLLEQEGAAAQVERQRTVARVEELVGRARELTGSRRWSEADLALGTARRLAAGNRDLSAQEQAALSAAIAQAGDELATARTAAERERSAAAAKEAAQREAERRVAEELFGQRQTELQWARLKEYRDQRKYEQAAGEAEAILSQHPNDSQARRAMQELQEQAAVAQQVETRQARQTETKASLADAADAAIPYAEILRYPSAKKWAELSEKRLTDLARQRGLSEGTVRTMEQLNTRVSLNNMTNVSLSNVLVYLGESSKTPIVVDPHLKDDTGKSPDDETVSINVAGVTLEQALRMVLPAEMGFRVDEGQIIISSQAKANPLHVVSYPVQDLVSEIPDFGATVPQFDLQQAMQQNSGGGTGTGGGGGGGGGGNGGLFQQPTTEQEKPEVKAGEKLIAMIKKFVTPTDPRVAAWDDAGGTATIEYFNGSLLVNQTDAGHRKVVELLNKLQ